jgi:hypothetical protein
VIPAGKIAQAKREAADCKAIWSNYFSCVKSTFSPASMAIFR